MPEGDTIHRTARRLRPALAGHQLTRFEAPRLVGDRPKVGGTIQAVEAVGKHLLIRFDDALVLHTHMKMAGSWHVYRTNERWREAKHLARAVVGVEDWVAVCFAAPIVSTFRDLPGTQSPIAHLGPDLCLDDVDIDAVLDRLASLPEPDAEIADALLDQRVAAGIGNVFKSETLWANRTSPFLRLGSVDTDLRHRLWATASRQLRANLGGGPRTTVPGGLAVYGRNRQPCLRCGTNVEMVEHGTHARLTYWCPTCQPAPQPEQRLDAPSGGLPPTG